MTFLFICRIRTRWMFSREILLQKTSSTSLPWVMNRGTRTLMVHKRRCDLPLQTQSILTLYGYTDTRFDLRRLRSSCVTYPSFYVPGVPFRNRSTGVFSITCSSYWSYPTYLFGRQRRVVNVWGHFEIINYH